MTKALGQLGRRLVNSRSLLRLTAGTSTSDATATEKPVREAELEIGGSRFVADDWTNISPRLCALTNRRLLHQPQHPIGLLKRRICEHLYSSYRKTGSTSPLFSLHENLHPVVSLWENFDSLLTNDDHPSRSRSETYYVNKQHVLRSHTSAHQHALISSGLDNFLVAGDVYRRDAIDRSHFPVFHQLEGVRLFTAEELLGLQSSQRPALSLFDDSNTVRTPECQQRLSIDASKALELNLKQCLEDLARVLFGSDIKCRWVDAYFPFTHPSWELEILMGNDEEIESDWMEMLGCGVIEQQLLGTAGVHHKAGWAFGLGLERLAMVLYQIPDIRLFWTNDAGFHAQFANASPTTPITFKPLASKQPPLVNDVSFWLPAEGEFHPSDFYELVRHCGGDLVEQVTLVDEFTHPKTNRTSHCYRIIYRHPNRVLNQEQVKEVHEEIVRSVNNDIGGEIRR